MTGLVGRPGPSLIGDLTCSFGLGFAGPRSGLLDELAIAIVPPVRQIDGGVEVAFGVGSEEIVSRYIEVESRRRADLEFSLRRTASAVVLRVTGRPDA